MKPSLTGQENGSAFVHAVVEYGRELLGFNLNKHAIRTYEKIGFKKRGGFGNEIKANSYNFISMAKDW